MGCHALQGIFPTQGSNPGLLCCRQTLPSEPPGSPSVDPKPLRRPGSTPRLLAEVAGALGFTLHSQTLLGGVPAQVLRKGKPRLRAPEKPVGPDSLWEVVWGLQALTVLGGLRGISAPTTPVGEGAGSPPILSALRVLTSATAVPHGRCGAWRHHSRQQSAALLPSSWW